MDKLTLKEFREIASTHKTAVALEDLSDADLLKSSLGHDIGLDSLDIIDMIAEFEVEYDVLIDSEAFDDKMYPAATEANVEKFLKACNECIKKKMIY